MKKISVILAGLLALAPAAYAASPSSVAAASGINPSSVYDNGGFHFGRPAEPQATGLARAASKFPCRAANANSCTGNISLHC